MRRLLPFLVASWVIVTQASFTGCDEYICALTTWEDSSISSLSLLQRGALLQRQTSAHHAWIAGGDNKKPVVSNLPVPESNRHHVIPEPATKIKASYPFEHKSHDHESSGSGVLISMAWSIPVPVIALSVSKAFASPSGVSYGICSCLLFGTSAYVIALSADFTGAATSPAAGLAYMGWVWLFFAVCIIGLHALFSFTTTTYQEEWAKIQDLPGKVWLSYLVIALFVCTGEAFVQLVCAQSLGGSAPHFAIASAYCIVVGPFFWFYAGERMGTGQLVGFLVVIVGVFVEGFSSWALTFQSLLVMVLFAIPCISVRLGEMWGSPPCAGVVIRLGFISACGAITTTICHTCLGVPFLSAELFLMAFYASMIISASYWSLIRGFEAQECNTAVVTGTLSGQTVVMILMNFFVMGWQPTLLEWLGMSFVVLGCFFMCWFTSTSKQGEIVTKVLDTEGEIVTEK